MKNQTKINIEYADFDVDRGTVYVLVSKKWKKIGELEGKSLDAFLDNYNAK